MNINAAAETQTNSASRLKGRDISTESAKEAAEKRAEEEQGGLKKPVSPKYDQYIHTEESASTNSAGIYEPSRDENGNPVIAFDDPEKQGGESLKSLDKPAEGEESLKAEDKPAEGEEPLKAEDKTSESEDPLKAEDKSSGDGESCTVNTDQVDAEIRKLREELEKIQQQMKGAANDPEKRANLEAQASRISNELQAKDNDAYRKANATYTFS